MAVRKKAKMLGPSCSHPADIRLELPSPSTSGATTGGGFMLTSDDKLQGEPFTEKIFCLGWVWVVCQRQPGGLCCYLGWFGLLCPTVLVGLRGPHQVGNLS